MKFTFPRQRLSYKQKKKDDWKVIKDFVNNILFYHEDEFYDEYDLYSPETRNKISSKRIKNMLSNYRLFNNVLDQSDFQEYCDALGIKASIDANMHEIKAYNKTYNKINVLLGEELKRPDNARVLLTNPEGVRSKLAYKDQLYKDYIDFEMQQIILQAKQEYPELDPSSFESQEEYQQEMERMEQEIQAKVADIMPPEEIEKFMKTKYLDRKEILASHLLQYLYKKERLKEKKNDGFKHANIASEEMVWVGIVNRQPVVEVLNPVKVFYHKSPEVKYVQDGMYAGYRDYLTISDVLDTYASDLTDKQKDQLEKRYCSDPDDENLISKSMTYGDQETLEYKFRKHDDLSDIGSYGATGFEDVEVIHLEWVSQKRVGFISYIDPETGLEMDQKVSEDFEVPEEAVVMLRDEGTHKVKVYEFFMEGFQTIVHLEWGWIPEVWEATKIDEFFVNIGPKRMQYYQLDNPFKVKLGYHGKVYNNMNAPALSTMDKMKPFQYLYFIAMDKFKKLIAMDKGKIIGIDSSKLDPKFPIEKTIHFLEEAGYYVYNGLQNGDVPGAAQRAGLEAIDGSTIAYVSNFAQILDYLDQQISDAAGVTKQREGGTSPYEAVANNQQAITQSSHITEFLFSEHDSLWNEIKQSLIETAQVCYRENPLITQFILNDGSRVALEVDEDFDANNETFGIFVSNSSKEDQIFKELRSLSQALIQNDRAKMKDIINILSADSLQELKRELITSEELREQREQEQQQQQMEHEENMVEKQNEAAREHREHEVNLKKMDISAILGKAKIDATRFKQAQDVNDNQIPDRLEIEMYKQGEKTLTDKANAKEKQKDREHEARENEKDRELKRQELKARPKSK